MFKYIDLQPQKHYHIDLNYYNRTGGVRCEDILNDDVADWLKFESGYYFLSWKKKRIYFFNSSDAMAFKLRF